MRVWEKNYLITLSLFAALFFASVFAVVSSSFSSALDSERALTLREEALLATALQQDIDDIEARENPSPQAVPALAASYAPAYSRRGTYLRLAQSGEVLFSNLPADVSAPDETASRVCVSLSAQGTRYLAVTDTLSGVAANYAFTYLKDISSLYASQQRQAVLLVSLAAAVSVAFAALLYVTLRRLYRPIDNLAHELRSPLTSIRGYAEYLQAAAATEEERWSAAQYIMEESQRLSAICEKLLVLANVREGEIAMGRVDMEALFARVKMAYPGVQYEAAQRTVRGDAALLQSLVMNLVSNAVKAGTEGAPVKLNFQDNRLEVRDSGCGMSAEDAARLSRPGKQPGAHTGEGNGLGVPLCHQIARAHRAQLVFTSAPGEGTTARVTFTAS